MAIQTKRGSLYEEYRALCSTSLDEGGIHPFTSSNGAVRMSIIQMHLKAAELGCDHFIKQKYSEFDATIGDHNCHLITHFIMQCSQDPQLMEEVRKVSNIVKQMKGRKNIASEIKDFDPEISARVKILASLALLKVATICQEFPDKPMVLRLDASEIKNKIAKTCPMDVIGKLLTCFRESVNRYLITHVQHLKTSPTYLSMTETATTSYGAQFQYVCASSSLKATLQDLHAQGIPFSFEHYDKSKNRYPAACFVPNGEFPSVSLTDPKSLDKDTKVMAIQMFYKDPEERVSAVLAEYGIVNFMLGAVARAPQFADRAPETYSNNEDIVDLPAQMQEDIKTLRSAKLPEYDIAHTYLSTIGDLCQRFSKM